MSQTPAQYFSSRTPSPLSTAQKAAMYKSFLDKKQNKDNRSWLRVYKSIAYSLSTMIVISTILFGNFFGFFDHKPPQVGQFVVAQTIGKIISSEGSFTILNKDNRPIASDSIDLTDRVIVTENSQVNILVQDSFVAQVFGPAQFEIILGEDNESYNLKFINGGDNIAINSVNETNKDISIQTSDGVIIKNNEKSQKLSFSVSKKPGETQRSIRNQSNSTIEVSDTQDKADQKVIVQGKHSLNFTKDNIDSDIQIISQEQIIDPPLPVVATGETQTGKVKPLTPQTPEVIHTITKDNIKTIKQSLDKSILNSEYGDLLVSYMVGKDNEYQIMIMNINKRLNRLAPIADIAIQQATTLPELTSYIQDIIEGFQKYNVSPELYINLQMMIKKIDEVPHHEYGFLNETSKGKKITSDFIYSIIDFNKKNNYL